MTKEELDGLIEQSKELVGIIEKSGCFEAKEIDVEKIRNCISELAENCIENKCESKAMLEWMDRNEFFESPASTKFHGNIKGGLCAHSLMVTYQALKFAPVFFSDWIGSKGADQFPYRAEDIFVATIAHDFCKAGFYATSYKNVKDIFGNWKRTPYFTVKNEVRNLGHGNESVLLLLESMPSFIKKRPVLEAISRHMGFSDLTETEKMNYSNFLSNPLVLLIQFADQSAAGWYDL